MILPGSCSRSPKPPSPLVLTQAQLEADNVGYEAFEVVRKHLNSLEADDYASPVRRLPQQWRAVYTTSWLDYQVNNGGHHQFFWNTEGALNTETLEDLKYIKADGFASIFEAAIEVYRKHDYEGEKRLSGPTFDGFDKGYEDKRLDECDSRFSKEPEKRTLADLLSTYIRENKNLFLKKDAKPGAPGGA